jgi:hypothetical protein
MIQFSIDLTPFITAIISVLVSVSVLVFTLERNKKLQAETAFFNLLTGIRNLVINTKGSVTVKNSSIISGLQGNDYFYAANLELQSRIATVLSKMIENDAIDLSPKTINNSKDYQNKAKEIYDSFYKQHVKELGHYFRFTYNVINFVHNNKNISKEKKQEYINFIQAQMNNSELQLIYFNAIGQYGQKYHYLIEEYNFLENLDTTEYYGIFAELSGLYPKSKQRVTK